MPDLAKERVWDGTFPWHSNGPNIIDKHNLAKIKNAIESGGPIVIKHWHFYGSSAPDTKAFDYYDDFLNYLKEYVIPGDIIDVWNLDKLINNENILVTGKFPDKDGLVPEKGAY